MPLRVLTYNVGMKAKERSGAIVDVVRSEDPDVVAFLDLETEDLAKSFAGELGLGHHFFARANNGRWHMAWLSRLPIEDASNYRLAPMFHTLMRIGVLWEGLPLEIFATHLRGIGRDSVVADEAVLRAQEAEGVLQAVKPHLERASLLVGDFNAITPTDGHEEGPPGTGWWSERYHEVPFARRPIELIAESGLVDCYRQLHPNDAGYTIHTNHPWSRIDFVFASPSVASRLVACEVVTRGPARVASHHFPVVAEFV